MLQQCEFFFFFLPQKNFYLKIIVHKTWIDSFEFFFFFVISYFDSNFFFFFWFYVLNCNTGLNISDEFEFAKEFLSLLCNRIHAVVFFFHDLIISRFFFKSLETYFDESFGLCGERRRFVSLDFLLARFWVWNYIFDFVSSLALTSLLFPYIFLFPIVQTPLLLSAVEFSY